MERIFEDKAPDWLIIALTCARPELAQADLVCCILISEAAHGSQASRYESSIGLCLWGSKRSDHVCFERKEKTTGHEVLSCIKPQSVGMETY